MRYFYAYPSDPPHIGQIIEGAAELRKGTKKRIHCWPENESSGRLLTDPIFEQIKSCDAVVADITKLNFNVVFEAGYAIGIGKKVYYTINSGTANDLELINEIGIFDTIGYDAYENTNELNSVIGWMDDIDPFFVAHPRNPNTPIYVVEHKTRTDGLTRIISRTKKSGIRYHSFNPDDNVRLSAFEAIQKVAESSGVIVPLASSRIHDAEAHNIRAAFVAGLAIGMNKATLLIQDYDGPAPMDVRELVKSFRHPDDINDFVASFVDEVMDVIQSVEEPSDEKLPPLTRLSIGDPMAENEMGALSSYYVSTDEYLRVAQGNANVVVGRKGMGKTALFTHLRNVKRKEKLNIIVDLKPEGYQIVKLREELVDYVTDGAKQHLFVAFWEYLLYMEIAYKLLEKDSTRRFHDDAINKVYSKLENVYEDQESFSEGDFSERLLLLSDLIRQRFVAKYGKPETAVRLTNAEVTELIYSHALPQIKESVFEYLMHKKSVWILFDNLDKGWPPEGIDPVDALILRCLLDATKKIERDMRRNRAVCNSVIFIRNDVYELLMQNSADFGKEMQVSLDWSDPTILSTMMALRLSENSDQEFNKIWGKYFVRLYDGVDTFNYFLERSIMRPRNLIKMVIHCRSFAINMKKDKIDNECITKGLAVYANDVLKEADEEIADIEPSARRVLYTFVGEKPEISQDKLEQLISAHCGDAKIAKIIQYMLYFGFVGIQLPGQEAKYVFDFHYNMSLLQSIIQKNQQNFRYKLNPAFWPVLQIGG